MNKKIKNAKEHEFNSIKFRSSLELYFYQSCLNKGLLPYYEEATFIVLDKLQLDNVDIYTKSKDGKSMELKSNKVMEITYTPDFIIKINDTTLAIIETKGFRNDAFPLKFKMFLSQLSQEYGYKFIYFEPSNKKLVDETIQIIINEIN